MEMRVGIALSGPVATEFDDPCYKVILLVALNMMQASRVC
jgi:hypothetical protein